MLGLDCMQKTLMTREQQLYQAGKSGWDCPWTQHKDDDNEDDYDDCSKIDWVNSA